MDTLEQRVARLESACGELAGDLAKIQKDFLPLADLLRKMSKGLEALQKALMEQGDDDSGDEWKGLGGYDPE